MAELARDEGAAVRWYEARGGRGGLLRTAVALAPLLLRVRRLVIGDPFSRLVQVLLPLCRAPRTLTVVDDGTATMEFTEILTRGGRLVRWHRSGRRRSPVDAAFGVFASAARRRLTPGGRRRVELFSAMPATPPAGMALRTNRFAWTRSRFGPPRTCRHRPDRHVAGRDRGGRPRPLSRGRRSLAQAARRHAGTSRTAGSRRTSCTGSPPRPAWRSSGPTCRSNSSPAAARSAVPSCPSPRRSSTRCRSRWPARGCDIVVFDIDQDVADRGGVPARPHVPDRHHPHGPRPPRPASGGHPHPGLAPPGRPHRPGRLPPGARAWLRASLARRRFTGPERQLRRAGHRPVAGCSRRSSRPLVVGVGLPPGAVLGKRAPLSEQGRTARPTRRAYVVTPRRGCRCRVRPRPGGRRRGNSSAPPGPA